MCKYLLIIGKELRICLRKKSGSFQKDSFFEEAKGRMIIKEFYFHFLDLSLWAIWPIFFFAFSGKGRQNDGIDGRIELRWEPTRAPIEAVWPMRPGRTSRASFMSQMAQGDKSKDQIKKLTLVFIPDAKFIIHETCHWRVNHCVVSKLPGYLMVAPRNASIRMIDELSPEGLGEMGQVIADTVRILKDTFSPEHIYVSRYGHTPDCGWHFHVIPVYGWVKELYRNDPRYRVLEDERLDLPTLDLLSVDIRNQVDGKYYRTESSWIDSIRNRRMPEKSKRIYLIQIRDDTIEYLEKTNCRDVLDDLLREEHRYQGEGFSLTELADRVGDKSNMKIYSLRDLEWKWLELFCLSNGKEVPAYIFDPACSHTRLR